MSSRKHVDGTAGNPIGKAAMRENGPKLTLPPKLASGLELKQIPSLDGLRAVAAFLVVFYHLGLKVSAGGEGVLIFFVLSGFLITWLLLKEQDRFGSVSLRLFYIRRTLRIFPAFYVYWALAMVILAIKHRVIWSQAMAAFLYVSNYWQAFFGNPNNILGHTWSLGIEEQFYLLWAPAFLLLQNTRREKVAKVLAAAIVGVWLYRLGLVWAGVNERYIYSAFDTRADQLLLGCLLAFSLRLPALQRFWNRLCSSIGYCALAVFVLVASNYVQHRYGVVYRDTVGFILDGLAVAFLIPLVICFRSSVAWFWLNLRPVRYLGRISYSIYLYQQVTPAVAHKIAPGVAGTWFVLIDLVVLIAVAAGSYHFIELPLLRLKDRFAEDKRAPSSAASTDGLGSAIVPPALSSAS